MSAMLEKAARAVFADLARQNDEAGEPCFIGDGYQLARAVLLAIRDPDEGMVRAFWSSPNADGYIYDAPGLPDSRGNMHTYEEWYGDGEQFRSAFTAMIDAILTTDATTDDSEPPQ